MIRTRDDLLFWRASAAVLALVAATGFALLATGHARVAGGLVAFDAPLSALHAGLALVAIAFATGRPSERASRAWAGGVGIFLLALAALGFLSARLFGLGPLVGTHIETSEDVLHLALGAWGAKTAFGER